MNKVSIIVPVYNVLEYLDDCITSIINQTYNELEIILVDDGSSDGSGEKCDQFTFLDNRISVIHQNNMGVSAARNAGIKAAAGNWIMFVDSDDWLELNAVEILLSKPIATECDVIAGSYYYNYPDFQERRSGDSISEYLFDMKEYRDFFFGMCLTPEASPSLFPEELHCGPNMSYSWLKLYKKNMILNNGIHFPDGIELGEDQLFNFAVISKCRRVFFINCPIYHYRMRKGSACNNSDKKKKNYLEYNKNILELIKSFKLGKNIEPYWDHARAQHMWNLAQLYAMSLSSVKDFPVERKELKDFVEDESNTGAVRGTPLSSVARFSRKTMVGLLKIRAYSLLLLLCRLYYVFNKKKVRI